ncbi:MAG: VOC family protein [Firmicutes bacterium]|nr:VOC family protein [Bacillota bacterium]
MKTRPYLTFKGKCNEALDLYKRAFNTEARVMHFGDMPANPNFPILDEEKDFVLQATLKIGDDYMRMSDCGLNHPLNESVTEQICISVEATIEETKHAFAVLAEEGRITMPLGDHFYSPCAGILFDKFGIMWNFAAEIRGE